MNKKINRYQQIALSIGLVLIIFTWIFGKSLYQTYLGLEVFGGREEQASHVNYPVMQQRLKDDVLVPIIIVELIGTITLVYLLRNVSRN